MKKFKTWLKSKIARVGMALSTAAVALCGAASAAEPGAEGAGAIDTASINTAFTTGLNNVVTTSIDLISLMLPIALSLFAVVFVVRKGMSWFKSMSK